MATSLTGILLWVWFVINLTLKIFRRVESFTESLPGQIHLDHVLPLVLHILDPNHHVPQHCILSMSPCSTHAWLGVFIWSGVGSSDLDWLSIPHLTD